MANFSVQDLINKGLNFSVSLGKLMTVSSDDKSVVNQAIKQLGEDLNKDGKVDVNDYLLFRNAESNDKAFNQYIKKYECVRLPDTDLNKLEEQKNAFQEENQVVAEAMTNLSYHMEYNQETKEFRLKLNDNVIYEGIEGHVNIMRLLKCMSINYSVSELNEPLKEPDFEE